MPVFAVIDVSARELTVAVLDGEAKPELTTFEQTPDGHRQLAAHLGAADRSVMEATGIYYLDAALVLDEAGLNLSVINPRAAHHFAKAMLETSKTDRIDAVILAEYARRMQPHPWQPPNRDWLAVRDLGRRINQLTASKTAAKNRRHALTSKSMTDPILIDDVEDEIRTLEARIERLSEAARARIRDDASLEVLYDILLGATGIGQTSALSLLSELCLLDRQFTSAQISRYAGLNVCLAESGSSVHRKTRLSKAGNAYLRAALHMPSLSLVQHDPIARAHYQQLIARGKKNMQALCAVQRKFLTGLWACIKAETPFDSSKLFAIRPKEA